MKTELDVQARLKHYEQMLKYYEGIVEELFKNRFIDSATREQALRNIKAHHIQKVNYLTHPHKQ